MRLGAVVNWIISKLRMKPKSIEQLILPFLISGWVIGRGIIEYPLGKRWPVTSFIYSLVLTVGYCTTVKLSSDYFDSHLLSKSKSAAFIYRSITCSFFCVVICNTLIGWKSMKGVKMIINRLEVSGGEMEKVGTPQDYRFVYRRQLITLLAEIFYVMFIVIVVYSWETSDDESLWWQVIVVIAFHYPVIMLSVGDAAFITVVRALKLRFEQLNRMLKQMLTTTDDSPQHKRILERTILKHRNSGSAFEKRTNDDPNLMRTALVDHYELVEIGRLINETLGTQALLSTTITFYFLVVLLWHTFVALLSAPLDDHDVQVFVRGLLMWVVFGGYKIISMTLACAKASDECKATAVIVCQLHEPLTSKAFRDEISDFSLQMMQHTVEFTACGFFSLDYGLLQAMIGAIASYFIICVQLGTPSLDNNYDDYDYIFDFISNFDWDYDEDDDNNEDEDE